MCAFRQSEAIFVSKSLEAGVVVARNIAGPGAAASTA